MKELHHQFEDIAVLIKAAKSKAFYEVNKTVIELYWDIGEYIFLRTTEGSWGKSIVKNLADYLRKALPNSSGFSAQNLWRMKQFHEAYRSDEKLSPLVREISWTNNMLILAGTQSAEEREFYLRLSIKEHYSKRELERQLSSGLFERVVFSKNGRYPEIAPGRNLLEFGLRDAYLLEFLDLPEVHSEKELRKSILANLKKFILEFGKDFSFVGEEFHVQVGKDDFSIDLLFFHRELCCLVAFDLKIDKFRPEYLGKMNFYLEVLDRSHKKPHENPSVGVVLCKEKEDEIVEIAMNRSASPTLVASYKTQLIDRDLLRAKLHEFYEISLLEKGE